MKQKEFSEKTILYLVHNYNSFQKDPIEQMSRNFKKVFVLVRYKPISRFVDYLPIKCLKRFENSYVIDLTNTPKNVEVILVPLWYLPFNFFYKFVGFMHARAVLKIIKKKKIHFDIIHAHFAWSAGYAGMKVKEKYKKPFVLTGHGYDIYNLPFRDSGWRKRIIEILNSADELIAVSKYTETYFEKLKNKKQPHVILNGFSEKLFSKIDKQEAREKLNLPKDKKILLTIGNLEKVKGYEILIEALKIVFEKRKDFLCIHIGAGVTEKKVLSLIKEFGLEKNVKLLGKKPHHELKHWFGACDIFVSPSLFETGPVVMFESLGSGRPFIGSRVGATTDVIISDKYGKLAEPGNAQELAKNILWGLEKDWDEDEISNYSKQYTWEKTVTKISNLYKKLI